MAFLAGASKFINDRDRAESRGALFNVYRETSVTGGTTSFLQIKVGAIPVRVIERTTIHTSKNLVITLLENPTLTTGTTVIPVYSTNRATPAVPTVVFYSNPTAISGGIPIFYTRSYGNGEGTLRTTSALTGSEWVLKANTNYIVSFRDDTGNTINLLWQYIFYEA